MKDRITKILSRKLDRELSSLEKATIDRAVGDINGLGMETQSILKTALDHQEWENDVLAKHAHELKEQIDKTETLLAKYVLATSVSVVGWVITVYFMWG